MSLYQLNTYNRLMLSNRLLPPGPVALAQEPPLTLAEPPRFVMILSGQWHRVQVVNTASWFNGVVWLCVDTGYGVRWFRRTQLVQWALMYAGTQRKETRHVLAA